MSKFLEAAMALLQESGGELNIVVLNKELFYLDLLALHELGDTVTGQKYIALKNGPVVAKYEQRLVRDLTKTGHAEQLEQGFAKPMRVLEPLATFEHLDDVVLRLVKKVAKVFAPVTSTLASDFSHENPGWKMAWAARKNPNAGELIIMNIALQQLADDEWIFEDADDEMRASAKRAHLSAVPWTE